MNNIKLDITLLYIITSFSFLSCCHSSELETNKMVFEIIEVDSWLNLMPGDFPKFHLAGRANIYSETELKDFTDFFKSINIVQNETRIHTFNPLVNLLDDQTKDAELFIYKIEFYTETGLRNNPVMNSDKNIDVELIFSSNLNMKNIILSDIKLEKAY